MRLSHVFFVKEDVVLLPDIFVDIFNVCIKNIFTYYFLRYLYKDVTWDGGWEETKPDSQGVRKVNYLNLKQTYASRSVSKEYKESIFEIFLSVKSRSGADANKYIHFSYTCFRNVRNSKLVLVLSYNKFTFKLNFFNNMKCNVWILVFIYLHYIEYEY